MWRPHRARRLWRSLKAFERRDPTLFVGIFAVWAFCAGLSLILTEDAFRRSPVFIVARDIGLSDNIVGAVMIANSVLLAFILGNRAYITKAVVLWITALLWTFWSSIMLGGSWISGVYSAAASFQLFCCVGLISAIANQDWNAP